jgi:multidrug resistance efflux pump
MSNLKPNVPEYRGKQNVFTRHMMGGWSFIVWIGMIIVTYVAYMMGGSFRPLYGQVAVVKEVVTSIVDDAKISEIKVQRGQDVKKGDVLAVLDTTLIDLEIEAAKRELSKDRLEQVLDALDRQRRLMGAVQDLRKSISEVEMQAESDKSAQATLLSRQKTVSALLKKGLVSDAELVKANLALAELEPKIKRYPEQIEQYKKEMEAILRLKEEMDAAGMTAFPGGNSATTESMENDPTLKELTATRENYTLRAASDGNVWRIERQPGENLKKGDSLLEIVKDVPPTVETFVTEDFTYFVYVGQEFQVRALTSPDVVYPAKVTAITANIVSQADLSSGMADRVVRGRRIVLTPEGETNLLPGESIMIEHVSKFRFW